MSLNINTNLTNNLDGYLLDAKNVKGGYVVVQNYAGLLALPLLTVVNGSLAYCQETSIYNANEYKNGLYQYNGETWELLDFGSGTAVNNTLSLQINGTTKTTFTANGSNATFNITASDLGLSGAMSFLGVTTTAITDGSVTNPITINNQSVTAVVGNVVIYENSEFVWTGSLWEELGSESSYALKTISVSGTGALDGGGTLTENRTITHKVGGAPSLNQAIYSFSTDAYSHISAATDVTSTLALKTELPAINGTPSLGDNRTLTSIVSDGVTYNVPAAGGSGTVESVTITAGTGLSSSNSGTQTTTVSTEISIATGYKLPTTSEWSGKQDALISGTTIKTLNQSSLLGYGNIDIGTVLADGAIIGYLLSAKSGGGTEWVESPTYVKFKDWS